VDVDQRRANRAKLVIKVNADGDAGDAAHRFYHLGQFALKLRKQRVLRGARCTLSRSRSAAASGLRRGASGAHEWASGGHNRLIGETGGAGGISSSVRR